VRDTPGTTELGGMRPGPMADHAYSVAAFRARHVQVNFDAKGRAFRLSSSAEKEKLGGHGSYATLKSRSKALRGMMQRLPIRTHGI
jgi:hypothetical protein